MKHVPKKNIDRIVSDIRRSDGSYYKPLHRNEAPVSIHRERTLPQSFGENKAADSSDRPYSVSGKPAIKIRRKKGRWGKIFILIILFSFLGGIFWVQSVLPEFKSQLTGLGEKMWNNFDAAGSALLDLNPEGAVPFFRANDEELSKLSDYQNISPPEFLSDFIPLIKKPFEFIKEIAVLNAKALSVAQNLTILKSQGLNFMIAGQGKLLIATLQALKNDLSDIQSGIGSLRNQISELKNLSASFGDLDQLLTSKYLDLNTEFYRTNDFLSGLIGLLGSADGKHFLLLFQNPSEMRPGGGFIGSYAHLYLKEGQIESIDVRDIYDPDGQLDLKVIPPEPLQIVTPGWGARDANWFFGFSESAAKVIEFMEASKIYSEKSVKFDGAIGVNVNVIMDLLELMGPVALEDYDLVIDRDNFLLEVQREVEAGEDKAEGEPKRILKVLTPILLSRLSALGEDEKTEVFDALSDRMLKKDIMFYFKSPQLQNFLWHYGFTGDVYNLPPDFFGGYLAVVNANIAGGKSDAFIKQEIDLETTLTVDGKTQNRLLVTRRHGGNTQKEWWWRAQNKDFIKILVPLYSSLKSVTGGIQREIKPLVDYKKYGYEPDPQVRAVEKTFSFDERNKIFRFEEYGKAGFATWLYVSAGKYNDIEIEYETPLVQKIESGRVYQFVFDKQSGVQGGIKIKIEAPPGYKWEEGDSSVFEYENPDPEARIILDLILKEI